MVVKLHVGRNHAAPPKNYDKMNCNRGKEGTWKEEAEFVANSSRQKRYLAHYPPQKDSQGYIRNNRTLDPIKQASCYTLYLEFFVGRNIYARLQSLVYRTKRKRLD